MSDYPQTFDRMMAAWNESEPTRIRAHLEEALTPDVEFIDPSISLQGLDAFEANVHEVHARIPGAVYSRTSAVDAHHRLYRYSWAIHRDGQLLLPGFDVVEVDDDDRVARVLGFFGPLEASD